MRDKFDASEFEGRKYGKWTVKRYTYQRGCSRMFLCECDCGTTKEIPLHNLTLKKSTQCQSCAARNRHEKKRKAKEKSAHRKQIEWLRSRWRNLFDKCDLCAEWCEWETFMGVFEGKLDKRKQLLKKDESSPFSPSNYVIVTDNRRGCKKLYTINGEAKSSREWCKDLGVTRERVRQLANQELGLCRCGREKPDNGACDCGAAYWDRSKHNGRSKGESSSGYPGVPESRRPRRIAWLKMKIACYQAELKFLESQESGDRMTLSIAE